MLARRTRLHSHSLANNSEPKTTLSTYAPVSEVPAYALVSTYRSLQMEIQIYSPSIKLVPYPGTSLTRSLPIFGHDDCVGGYVVLHSACSHSGRLSISIEGAAWYYGVNQASPINGLPEKDNFRKRKHVFFSSSTAFAVSSPTETRPPSAFREKYVQRRPSLPILNARTGRSCPFRFDLPRGTRLGEEIPPTFSSSYGTRNYKTCSATVEITYTVTASWQTDDLEYRSILEAPIIVQPETEFQSLDGSSGEPDSWLEMPLRSDRSLPFQCAITLPNPMDMSRAKALPYFVVFTTTPRSPTLAKEIASDATITVSLLRQVSISESPPVPLTPSISPSTPSSSSDDLTSPLSMRKSIFRRAVKTSSSSRPGSFFGSGDVSPPALPVSTIFSESRTLMTNMFIGFPKRPRMPCNSAKHPRLEDYAALPDGLMKGKIQLTEDTLPCIDWAGVRVKYYLDVSVVIRQDELRARIPVRMY